MIKTQYFSSSTVTDRQRLSQPLHQYKFAVVQLWPPGPFFGHQQWWTNGNPFITSWKWITWKFRSSISSNKRPRTQNRCQRCLMDRRPAPTRPAPRQFYPLPWTPETEETRPLPTHPHREEITVCQCHPKGSEWGQYQTFIGDQRFLGKSLFWKIKRISRTRLSN